MVIATSLSKQPVSTTRPRSSASSTTNWRSGRFSRTASSSFGINVERPPVILEWDPWLVRVGLAEQHKPQHVIPNNSNNDASKRYSEEEWYLILAPILSKIWDRLKLDPSLRRVVCVKARYMQRTWEAAMLRAMYDLDIPAVSFVNGLETIPYAMGWTRGMVVHVGRYETQCLAIADSHALYDTYQAVPCGYERVVPPDEETNKSTIEVNWTSDMDKHWLNEENRNGLMMALLKSLTACPRDARKDICSNLVFCGETCVLVPDLARRVRDRLIAILHKTAPLFEDEPTCDLVAVPIDHKILAPLSSCVAVTSTAPLRPDLVSWVGASVLATVWHRHDDETNPHIRWTLNPHNQT